MTPSVFLVRHGETEWSATGKYTGKTEKMLTEAGISEAIALGDQFVGDGKHIDLSSLVRIFVSPRVRAKETFELVTKNSPKAKEKASFDEYFSEWDHGDYEGMTTKQIRDLRARKGLDTSSKWSIWTGGCEGGESVEHMTRRINQVISLIKDAQKDYMDNEEAGNVMIVGHGTHLRCLWKIWHGFPIDSSINIKFETGTLATLSYKDIDNQHVIGKFDSQAEYNIGIRHIKPASR